MNIQVRAAEYKTGAEVIAAARSTRFKMFGPEKRVNWKPAPEPERIGPPMDMAAEPPKDPRLMPFWRPLWMRMPLRFEAHVWAYHRHMGAGGHPVKEYTKRRCFELNVDYADLMVKTRKKQVVFIRHLIWWEIKNWVNPDFSFTAMGKIFGGFDHTSVMHGVRKIQALKDAGAIE